MKALELPPGQPGRLCVGIAEPATAAVSAELLGQVKSLPKVLFLIDKSQKAAEGWAEDLKLFARLAGQKEPRLRVYPEVPDVEEDDPRLFAAQCDRLAVLSALQGRTELAAETLVIATTLKAFFEAAPSLQTLQDRQLVLEPGMEVPFKTLAERLGEEFDYYSEVVCEGPGQFAVRGGIIDIYPLNGEAPCRVDFFGDEIESIREIDPTTQRSGAALKSLSIAAAGDQKTQDQAAAIIDFLAPLPVAWFLREPGDLEAQDATRFNVPERIKQAPPSFREVMERPASKKDHWYGLVELETDLPLFTGKHERRRLSTEPLSNYRSFPDQTHFGEERFEAELSARKRFLQQLLDWKRAGERVTILFPTEGEQSRLREMLAEDAVLKQLEPEFEQGSLHEGFRMRGAAGKPGWVLVTDAEIFGRHRHRQRHARLSKRKLPERSAVDQALDFSELADGDPLVHLSHGICLFRGLQRMELRGREEEMISVEFANGSMLHVPLYESHLLTRYVGLTKTPPKLGKLGTNSWEKTRKAAERATLDFAAQLLTLQATRESAKGYAFSADNQWMRDFEASFAYKETPDQLRAIGEVKADMEQERPMDRLVCGDVGFGKTEVAIRAAFKAVLSGKQVAVLTPTTVLCQQHFSTFRERMAEYPVVVEQVSRFRTPQQNSRILRAAQEGKIDLLVGTHRILSDDVQFKDLGLVVIDEEQRFGVKQKERLKELKANTDIITLSATPIPRTLYMALAGARELSVIETAPAERLPIQTVVKTFDEDLVRLAIRRELDRGGQAFYLHNRVGTIDKVAGMIEALVPDARVAVGHGQMDEGMLEQVMTRFVAGEYDVLVCTTIIESGLDIPNCNTLIIDGADRFGLSQLYQIRGRVGRFNRQAYAYLLLHKKATLLDPARKRLASIRQYNQLGAGFRIAMRDLELRGAGNILGAQQSGHIAGVGFDLYCQLLRQSVARLKGEAGAERIRATVRLDFVIVGRFDTGAAEEMKVAGRGGFADIKAAELKAEETERIEAFLPDPYIAEARLRIDIYRQLAMAEDAEAVEAIAEALEDRFGKHPAPVQALLLMTQMRCEAEKRGINLVETEGSKLKLQRAQAVERNRFVQIGSRFPRLTRKKPLARLKEILQVLKRSKA